MACQYYVSSRQLLNIFSLCERIISPITILFHFYKLASSDQKGHKTDGNITVAAALWLWSDQFRRVSGWTLGTLGLVDLVVIETNRAELAGSVSSIIVLADSTHHWKQPKHIYSCGTPVRMDRRQIYHVYSTGQSGQWNTSLQISILSMSILWEMNEIIRKIYATNLSCLQYRTGKLKTWSVQIPYYRSCQQRESHWIYGISVTQTLNFEPNTKFFIVPFFSLIVYNILEASLYKDMLKCSARFHGYFVVRLSDHRWQDRAWSSPNGYY